jgi:hypothetical protein
MPILRALLADFSPARVAAKGVLLRAPLKPMVPAESQRGLAVDVGDGDDRVVEGRLDVGDAADHVLADFLASCHDAHGLLRIHNPKRPSAGVLAVHESRRTLC